MTDEHEHAVGLEQRNAVWTIASVTAAPHLVLAGRYNVLRKELYFIVCGRHPAFGYVDQPALLPLLAAATQLFADNIWMLWLPWVVVAAALPHVAAALARLLRGSTVSVWLAAAAVALVLALAGFTATLTTSTFESVAVKVY